MKLSQHDQESIINLLTRIYQDILTTEEEFQLVVGDGDFRPRIEYFHDAIRAFTSQHDESANNDVHERLNVTLLSYDLKCLRYIQDMPLSSFKPHGDIQSPGTDIMTAGPGLSVEPKRPDRKIRARICELYQNYAVLFAALLKPVADRDYHDSIEELNMDIQDLDALAQELEAMAEGKDTSQQIANAAQHLEEKELRQLLIMFLQHQKHKQKDEVKKLLAFLKKHSKDKNKQVSAIESAHMHYALNQLGIFENSKDLLKKMALQGTNIVGKFVESSIAETRREIGR